MNPFAFLVDILLHLYSMVLMLRVILQWAGADFYNPVCQFIVKVSNPLVKPARRIIPGFFGIDFATLVLVIIIIMIKIALVYSIAGYSIVPVAIIIGGVLETIQLLLNIFLYAIIIQALMSWLNPDPYNPMMSLLGSITWPVLKHFKKIIPPMGGFDLSSMAAIITIMFVQQSLNYFL